MALTCSIIIVSYRRTEILKETLELLQPIIEDDIEVVIVEQLAPVENADLFSKFKHVRYFNLEQPGMVGARNFGILQAQHDIVLFLDDDIRPSPQLIQGHLSRYSEPNVGGVAGHILELNQDPIPKIDPKALDPFTGLDYVSFNHLEPVDMITARGCNMSFRRGILLDIGGFDTYLLPPFSFREDSDISFRVRQAGYRLAFEPTASLLHLSAKSGGTRGFEKKNIFKDELKIYTDLFNHCRDDMYFHLKHFSGLWKWRLVWKSFRSHVGVSRYPWRWLAKFLYAMAALVQATYLTKVSKPPYFPKLTQIDQLLIESQ
jgi:GT2 family glycosyltransferase